MKNTLKMRQSIRIISLSFSFLLLSLMLKSEGTRETAPNSNTDINGTLTNDIAALHIDSPNFNNFASFNNPNVNSRLHIHIADPLSENILLGFSFGHLNSNNSNPPPLDFEYRILDPNGNVVFGPIEVNGASPDINNWAEAFAGPSQLVGSMGYDATQVNALDLSSGGWTTAGDYYIEFNNLDDSGAILIDYWDITVVSNTGTSLEEKKGRVWSYNWALFAINDFGFPVRPFNGSFYVCAPDVLNPEAAFVTEIDFNGSGFRPAAFNIAFNSFGTQNTGNITTDRRSRENINSATPEYAIFLNDPVDICETAQAGGIDILSISRCDSEDYCINFVSTRSGQIDLLLDFDGRDDIFTPGTADVMITQLVNAGDVGVEVCLPWDGRDGLGNLLLEDTATEIPISLSFAQGIYHFPIYDAELMTNGFEISNVRPTGPKPLLYYDDTEISVPSGTGEPNLQLMGCDLPCHGWTNYTTGGTIGFGNLNTINSWWFSQQTMNTEVLLMPSFYSCSIEGTNVACEGDSISLELITEYGPDVNMPATINNLNWTGPGIVSGNGTNTIEIDASGVYQASFDWENNAGDTCSVACEFAFTLNEASEETIDTLLEFGTSVTINTETYDTDGTYTQILTAVNGCDSILTIIVEVDVPEVMLECTLMGDTTFCEGDMGTLDFMINKIPVDAPDPTILSVDWTLNGTLITSGVNTIDVNQSGEYVVSYTWINFLNDTITQSCALDVEVFPSYEITIDTLISEGETIVVDGMVISSPGQFINNTPTVDGCDSLVIVNVIQEASVVYYDLDNCKSSDYERFTPEYPSPLTCAEIEAFNLHRDNPALNSHSCTPGVNGGIGLCVSSVDDCDYDAGNEKSIIIELVVTPGDQEAVQLTSLRFYERAPEEFQWIVGTEGLNNYPTLYGVRVLKNGQEIYRSEDNTTTLDWTAETFNFAALEDFKIQEPAHFRIELLAYCLVGNDSNVTAWDIDEVSIQADCAEFVSNRVVVGGQINNVQNEPLENINVNLKYGEFDFQKYVTTTDEKGEYAFDNVLKGNDYMIKPVSADDYLNGVSTADLIHIQRHILGLDRFESPYKMIAADADKSKSITAIDILQLRKLILGIQTELPNNESWRYIKSNQELHISNPWNIEEVSYLENLGKNKTQSFYGVKIGDINDDNSSFKGVEDIESRKSHTSQIYIDDVELKAGIPTSFIVTINSHDEILGYQFALKGNGLEFLKIEDEGFVDQIHYQMKDNKMVISYDNINHSCPNEIMISILPLKNGRLSDVLSIDNSTIKSELYSGDNIDISQLELLYNGDFEFASHNISVYPNPFNDITAFRISASENDMVTLKIFDISGKLLLSKKMQIEKGENVLEVSKEDIGLSGGMLMYNLRSNTIANSGRLLLVE